MSAVHGLLPAAGVEELIVVLNPYIGGLDSLQHRLGGLDHDGLIQGCGVLHHNGISAHGQGSGGGSVDHPLVIGGVAGNKDGLAGLDQHDLPQHLLGRLLQLPIKVISTTFSLSGSFHVAFLLFHFVLYSFPGLPVIAAQRVSDALEGLLRLLVAAKAAVDDAQAAVPLSAIVFSIVYCHASFPYQIVHNLC